VGAQSGQWLGEAGKDRVGRLTERYWWAIIQKEGKTFVSGPYMSNAEAHQRGSQFGTVKALAELPTRDENRATRMIKHRLESTENLSHVISR